MVAEKKRLVTALVAGIGWVALLLGAPGAVVAAAVLGILGLAGWEWGRLVGLRRAHAFGFGAGVVIAAALLWRDTGIATGVVRDSYAAALLILSLVLWFGPFAWVMLLHPSAAIGQSRWMQQALIASGAVVLVAAGVAALGLWARSPGWLLAALVHVWVIDTVAYGVGRRWGRRALAPLLSPNKTVEGAVAAFIGAFFYSLFLYPAIGARLPLGLGAWLGLMLIAALLAIEGDLWESWLKRRAGVKDSGSLLPGHGGVLDRIDAQLAALPLLALAWLGWGS